MSVHPRSMITNLKFVYKNQKGKLTGLLKYFQHRDDKAGHTHIPQVGEDGKPIERWVDQGLGQHYRDILANSQALATSGMKQDVGARLMVVAPEINLMHAIDEDRRVAVLEELTETTLEGWFEKMNLPTAEFSYVAHESEPSEARPDGRTKDEGEEKSYLHTHVVLAATVPGLESERQNYRVYERHISQLHEAGREALERIWTRELGQEKFSELQAELSERDARQRELDQQHQRQEAERFFGITPERQAAAPEITLPLPIDRDLGLEIDR